MDIVERLQYEQCSEGLQQEAADEIAALRTRLELDESGVDGIQCRDATIRLQDDEIRKLRAKLEAVQRTVESYHEELAASQAREASMCAEMEERCGYSVRHDSSDDSALRERLAKERERCASVCETRHANGNWKHDTRHECAEAIRAIGDEA